MVNDTKIVLWCAASVGVGVCIQPAIRLALLPRSPCRHSSCVRRLVATHADPHSATTPVHSGPWFLPHVISWPFCIFAGRRRCLAHCRSPLGGAMAARLDDKARPISLACPAGSFCNSRSSFGTHWVGISAYRGGFCFSRNWLGSGYCFLRSLRGNQCRLASFSDTCVCRCAARVFRELWLIRATGGHQPAGKV